VVDASFSVAITNPRDPLLQRAVDRFLNDLRRQTGMLPLDMKVGDISTATLVVSADHQNKDVQVLGEDESYSLEINAAGAKVIAPTSLGAMYGLQTFLQLVRSTRGWLCCTGGEHPGQTSLPLAGIDD
jgi:hexosaminidase